MGGLFEYVILKNDDSAMSKMYSEKFNEISVLITQIFNKPAFSFNNIKFNVSEYHELISKYLKLNQNILIISHSYTKRNSN